MLSEHDLIHNRSYVSFGRVRMHERLLVASEEVGELCFKNMVIGQYSQISCLTEGNRFCCLVIAAVRQTMSARCFSHESHDELFANAIRGKRKPVLVLLYQLLVAQHVV